MSKRPTSFSDIIGQEDVKQRLKISAFAHKAKKTTMPHVLIDGPPGLGKTTIAGAIANELGADIDIINAANIRSVRNILPYLMKLQSNSVLFVDEIHRLPKVVEEFLYPVMEDFRMEITIDKNPESIDLPRFTMVGATTSSGSLSQPFYDRFMIKEHLSFYKDEELADLAKKNISVNVSDSDLLEIAKRSKGTPRILNSRIDWYESYTTFYPEEKDVAKIFDIQGIDTNGFDKNDRKYIGVLNTNIGNPLGLKALSNMTGISMETIENNIEPYMIRQGYVIRTQKGRILGKIDRSKICQ
jgi:Holliday junction DNA helicase RuvB